MQKKLNNFFKDSNLSESCKEDLKSLVENQVVKIKRGSTPNIKLYKSNLGADIDKMVRAFTGKSIKQHTVNTIKSAGKAIGDKIAKTAPIKNTIGKKKLEKAESNLLNATINNEYAKKGKEIAKKSNDPYKHAIYKDLEKRSSKDVSNSAKEVNNVKDKYGL